MIAVERLGRRPVEVVILEQSIENRLVDLPAQGQGAVPIEGRARMLGDPIIEHGVARAAIEGEHIRLARTDPGDVRHAADIEHGQRPVEATRQGRVVERRQGRPLPSSRHIEAAKIRDHGDPHLTRQQGAVADLPGTAFGRRMIDRLAMKPDISDVRARHTGLLE